MKKSLILMSLFCVTTSTAFARQEFRSNSSVQEEKMYDELFPTYAEACAGSQELPFVGAQGGSIGHELLYVRGLCRDEKSAYPRLRECSPADKYQGVGISVDQTFKNVNWVAVDDRDFIFRGGLKDNEPLTKEAQEAAINEAIDRGYFKNIQLQTQYFKGYPAGESQEKWLARESLGTSYALNFHRNLLCARMPLPKSALLKMKTYLNALNEQYFLTGKTYEWSVLTNNCSHVVHNAFAAAGVMTEIHVGRPMPIALLDIAAPSNDWAITVHNANFETNNAEQVYGNGRMRKLIKEEGWMISQAGGLVEVIPVHAYENKVADTKTEIHMLGIPGVGAFTLMMDHYLNKPAYFDLRTNLLTAKMRLDRGLQSRLTNEELQQLFMSQGRTMPRDYLEFYSRYYEALQKQSDDLSAQIARFLADEG